MTADLPPVHAPMVLCPNCRRPLDERVAEANQRGEVPCCRRLVLVPETILDVLRARALDEVTP